MFGVGAKSRMPFVSKIYIRNKKNKPESIEKIFLEFPNKIIIPIAIYDNKPLLIKPFDHVVDSLNTASYYHTGDDHTNPYIIANYSDEYMDGISFLYDKKNRIIIQTQERLIFVKPNIEHKKFNFKNSTMLEAKTNYGERGTILSHNIKEFTIMKISKRPSYKEFLGTCEPSAIQSITNELDEAEEFGVQFNLRREGNGYRSANYYFLNEDNQQVFSPILASWNKDFHEQYKTFLKKQSKVDSMVDLCEFIKIYFQSTNMEKDSLSLFASGFGEQKPPKTLQSLLKEIEKD